MKKQLLFCVLIMWSLTLFSQDKSSLTKEETVNYLLKKSRQSIGQEYKSAAMPSQSGNSVTDIELTIRDCDLFYRVIYSGNRSSITFSFNPKDIATITIGGANADIGVGSGGVIQLNLKSATGLKRYPEWKEYNSAQPTSTVYIHYLAADVENFSKIKKAFEYLRDLCKAEDDPFGN